LRYLQLGREIDYDVAIGQLEAAGAVITTAETVLLQLVPDTQGEHFAAVRFLSDRFLFVRT